MKPSANFITYLFCYILILNKVTLNNVNSFILLLSLFVCEPFKLFLKLKEP